MSRDLLKDIHVRNAKPRDKAFRLKDGDGLFLFMPPSGVASWQYRYKLAGKHQTLTLGKVSTLSLKEARRRCQEARANAADGKHLTTTKRVERANLAAAQSTTFQSVAESWMSKPRSKPWSDRHCAQVRASINNHLSDLNLLPVTEITARVASPILDKVQRRAPLMFQKVRARLNRILDHAVLRGMLERNPLPAPEPERHKDRKHYPAVTDLPTLGKILRAARAADPAKGVQRAHTLVVFTALRISEAIRAQWSEFDLKTGIWAVPRERMKIKDPDRGPFEIPLPPQLLATVREWRMDDGPNALIVCVAPRNPKRSITPESVEKHYREVLELDGKHSPHSWRSAFSTVAREAGKKPDTIAAQLDHVVGNKVESAYDRAKRVRLRGALLAWYEAQLIAARDNPSLAVSGKCSAQARQDLNTTRRAP